MPIIQHLVADQFGSHVGKYSGRLKITQKKETLAQAPLLHLQSVTIANKGVSISADAIRACTEHGIPIHFLSTRGTPYAALYSSGLTGTVLTRRAQLTAYQTAKGICLALAFAHGKIENQANLLKYIGKYRKETDPDCYNELRLLALETADHTAELSALHQIAIREGNNIVELRDQILSAEGRAAKKYWAGVKLILPEKLNWGGREGRGATDPFNSALNYGYGILYGEIERALVLAGLDPYGGFIHVDRPGKPSLVLDFIEEFRAPVVDRTLIGMVNKGTAIEMDEYGKLSEKTRRTIAGKVTKRLESHEKYEGKRNSLHAIIQMQARHIATYVRGDREEYHPFIVKW